VKLLEKDGHSANMLSKAKEAAHCCQQPKSTFMF